MIYQDLFRYKGNTGFSHLLKNLVNNPGFKFTFFFRLASSKLLLMRLFFRPFYKYYMFKYGIQIPTRTEIDEGFYIGHFGTIVVNGKTKIGKNCNISPGVVIGQANRGKRKGVPTIGNKVWMGSNSIIVGKITIGNNVLIAPGTYINSDIPDNSIVIGNPAKIIPNEKATEDYINNCI